MRLSRDVILFTTKELPKWNPINICSYHLQEAGATPVQEVAFTLANAKEYVRAALSSGLAIDDFAPRLSFFFVARTTLLEEVAKFRAARRLWARIMKEEFKAEDPRSQMLRFHTQTAGVQLTAQQPEVNLIRVSLQALAAVLGGTQSLHTNSFDEALALRGVCLPEATAYRVLNGEGDRLPGVVVDPARQVVALQERDGADAVEPDCPAGPGRARGGSDPSPDRRGSPSPASQFDTPTARPSRPSSPGAGTRWAIVSWRT